MSDCGTLINEAGNGLAPTLQAVDCMTANAGAGSFGHLMGAQGVLAPALTAALTIYVAAYGLALITGRVRLGLGGVSGRMLAVGLVLAFATSWAFYGPLVYRLATLAPDQVAGTILGTRGSATAVFAQRIDTIYAAVSDATHEAAEQEAARNAAAAAAQQQAGAPVAVAATPPPASTNRTAGFAPGTIAMAGAIVLLLSTVGVLVTARIVLAALLLIGPVFVVMALFPAVRGLFAGWARTILLAAFAPMLVVLGGAFSLELAVPTVARLLSPDGIDQSAATGFFLIATVHAALMAMALRAAAGLVAGWRPWAAGAPDRFGSARRDDPSAMVIGTSPAGAARTFNAFAGGARGQMLAGGSDRRSTSQLVTRDTRTIAGFANTEASAPGPRRAAGIGSRFRPASVRPVMK